jgi:hypothetical protein
MGVKFLCWGVRVHIIGPFTRLYRGGVEVGVEDGTHLIVLNVRHGLQVVSRYPTWWILDWSSRRPASFSLACAYCEPMERTSGTHHNPASQYSYHMLAS